MFELSVQEDYQAFGMEQRNLEGEGGKKGCRKFWQTGTCFQKGLVSQVLISTKDSVSIVSCVLIYFFISAFVNLWV